RQQGVEARPLLAPSSLSVARIFSFFSKRSSASARIGRTTSTGGGLTMSADHTRDEWVMAETALGKREALEMPGRHYASPLLTFVERMVGELHRSEVDTSDMSTGGGVGYSSAKYSRPSLS